MLRASRRLYLYIALGFVFSVWLLTRRSSFSWRDLPLEAIGLGEETEETNRPAIADLEDIEATLRNGTSPVSLDGKKKHGHSNIFFTAGETKPVGENYTKALVIPRTTKEDVAWIARSFPADSNVIAKIYVVDDTRAPLHPPKNKGHEVMVYLSYIIDHYDDNLADVNIFMHSHQFAWHNNEYLDLDAVQIIRRLSAERVQREGYVNLRCSWDPGCPAWLHPGTTEENVNKQEEVMLARGWSELFPLDPIPSVLAQPCCAQFAISRARILALPKAKYVFYRDWLLRTRISDFISGRIWEYLWQYVFTGQPSVCTEPHVCYCDGYGMCFGGKEGYDVYVERMFDKRHWEEELRKWKEKDDAIQNAKSGGSLIDESKELIIPEVGEDIKIRSKIEELDNLLKAEKQKALERGDVPQYRALDCGREWKEGDGF